MILHVPMVALIIIAILAPQAILRTLNLAMIVPVIARQIHQTIGGCFKPNKGKQSTCETVDSGVKDQI